MHQFLHYQNHPIINIDMVCGIKAEKGAITHIIIFVTAGGDITWNLGSANELDAIMKVLTDYLHENKLILDIF